MLRKLLIVDDDPLNLTLITEMLGRNSYEYIRALNGVECLEAVAAGTVDMIIMDWQMPKMDGMEALRNLKTDSSTSHIPVLMMTGVMTAPVDLMTAMEEGAVDFLQKPFERLELRARVRNMLMLSDAMTELKEKYLQIESSSKMIEALFTGIPLPLVYYTTDGIIIRCNHHFLALADIEGDSVEGRLIYSLFTEDTRSIHLRYDLELKESGEEVSYESACINNGLEYLFTKNLHRDPEGIVSGIICSITDITHIKQAHAHSMEAKKRELVSSALRLIHFSEMNNNVISGLGRLQTHVDEEGRGIISEILRQNNLTSAEDVWQDFETRFENVFESFYHALDAQFPDLTPGERKLCALLRLNISSKDIAAITHQNPNSVDMARYRLRKKMNLNPADNLVDFLLKIDQ